MPLENPQLITLWTEDDLLDIPTGETDDSGYVEAPARWHHPDTNARVDQTIAVRHRRRRKAVDDHVVPLCEPARQLVHLAFGAAVRQLADHEADAHCGGSVRRARCARTRFP